MRIINTLADIELLERYEIIPESLLKWIKEQFQVVYEYNQDDETEEEFSLEHSGPIFILELGDNLHDLSALGLHSQERGFLGTIPELIEVLELNQEHFWKVMVVYNDSYAPTFYLKQGIHGEEVDRFLTSNRTNYIPKD